MARTSNVFDFLNAGIRAETLRQKTIASNVANLETPEYRSVGVKFEELLSKAMSSQGKVDMANVKPEVYEMKQTAIKSNGNDVSLESEVGRMVKNTLRHKTYMRILRKKYDQIELAIK